MNVKVISRGLISGLLATLSTILPVSADALDPNLNYTFITFDNGYPTPLSSRRPQALANKAARANPDLVIQTGTYSLRLDCDDMQLTGFDALAGTDYLTALHQDVTVFSPARLLLTVSRGRKRYVCTSARIQDPGQQYVRLIASGQYVQRFDHLGLVFTAEDGTVLDAPGRFEVTAWPDRAVFQLDFSADPGVTQTTIRLTSPSGRVHQSEASGNRAFLALSPQRDQDHERWEASSYITSAEDAQGSALDVRFDEAEHALHIDIPAARVDYPEDTDRVDEYVIDVTNPEHTACQVPLVFDQVPPRAITGTVMTLCEEADGRPTGIPVQISKNWHRDKDHPTVHEGSWLRGYTVLSLNPGETKRIRLRVIYGYWGGAGAVSHAQLSVIGYGGNWKWDESALGAWGESMTYDPTQHLGSAFIDDVRPAFTTSMSGQTYGWTENVGGGDFLIYHDSDKTLRWAKRLKTAYHWTGPNMTEVLYSGITDDEKIRFTYRTRSVRTNDYHRRFHAYRYEFVEDVMSPARLVFHQMAADYYSYVEFDRFYVGDQDGLQSTHAAPEFTVKGYTGAPIPFEQAWLALDDARCNDGPVRARRGLLALSSKLNGEPFPIYLHTYALKRNHTLLDMSSASVRRSYAAGDVVEGELEIILPPRTPGDYWGHDRAFETRLGSYGDNAWQAVYDEYRYNTQLRVTAHRGTLLQNYPVEIQSAATGGEVLADFTIHGGGIGHVPVLLRGVPRGCALEVQWYEDGRWIPWASEDLDRNSTYQGYRDDQGRMNCVLNVERPYRDLDTSWRIRMQRVQ
jgi:hypothetical protein